MKQIAGAAFVIALLVIPWDAEQIVLLSWSDIVNYFESQEDIMIRIATIDTGVNLEHPDLINKNIVCKHVDDKGDVTLLKGNSDKIGHGTAICGILAQQNNVEITVFKAFDLLDEIDEDSFISVLDYLSENEHFDILNLSLGTSVISQYKRLEQVCRTISDSGTLIVASFSNYGTVTYPAAWPFVIGVDWDIECKKNTDFIFCENSIVDVYGKGMNQKLCWSHGSNYIVNAGASFATAHITSYLIPFLEMGEVKTCNDAKLLLKKRSMKKISAYRTPDRKLPDLNGKKVAIFPYNKEIRSITNYSDLLSCEVTHIYDIKQAGNVNKSTSFFSHRKSGSKEFKIQDFQEIINDKDSIDVLIVGHLSEINRITNHNYTKDCVDFCLIYGKTMVSFDTITNIILNEFSKKKLVCYNMNIDKVSYDISEKLRIIGTPIITIAGTSSQQGKFSLQLELRKEFLESGYSVGQWCTEPQGFLFGMDQVFPVGYGSNINFSEKKIIHEINSQLHEIEKLEKDIIITGLQSYLVCEKLYNTHLFPTMQTAILAAIQPDAIILVVNVYDSDKYIIRSIKFAESVTGSRVVCIALSFRNVQASFSPLEQNVIVLTDDEIAKYTNRISDLTGIVCYSINQTHDIFESIINYLN